MTTNNRNMATVNEQGQLVIPKEVMQQYGFLPGAQVRLEQDSNHLRLHRPATHLNKVYLEPTNHCNLSCSMCLQSGWEEPRGNMSPETFAHVLRGLAELQPLPTVFFGGIGEPLYHEHTIEWVAAIKALGARVELITNGTLLNERRSRQLIETGLDMLWVSIDGATPESYTDVRSGAQLPTVIQNLTRFRSMRKGFYRPRPEVGVSFVAMKRNIHDLPEVIKLGRSFGATRFSISNVMPYTQEMQAERLYLRTLNNITYLDSPWLPKLTLPRMDINPTTQTAFFQALNSGCNVNFAGSRLSSAEDVCNFVESGSTSIAWDGYISPCWPLMHTHTSYLHNKEHLSRRYTVGNVSERSLLELWLDPEYVAYRQKVQRFGFAPCTFCGGCELSETNEEDCFGNGFPACGSCLWSQGIIQCP